MTLPRLLVIFSALIFGLVFAVSLYKGEGPKTSPQTIVSQDNSLEMDIDLADSDSEDENPEEEPFEDEQLDTLWSLASPPQSAVDLDKLHPFSEQTLAKRRQEVIANVDRLAEFFNKGKQKFPIVETMTYTSRVPWLKGRAAWLSDYASHYKTSRHFIARSLNGRPDYEKQNLAEGDRFNVLNREKNIEFHLVIDAQLCKMWFYYYDVDAGERVLVKVFDVGLGQIDESRESGLATPFGVYTLGSQVAIYKPGKKGIHNGENIEMIRVIGTRWIPFDQEVSGCTEPAKGYGIHGVPWLPDAKGELREDLKGIGKYESAGCVRMATADIEALFSIIITKPTTLHIVQNYREAQLPGIEKP